MRLILHIGTAKTGTTTLQRALSSNTRLWAKHGILYPTPAAGHTNHNLLTTLLHPMEQMPREFTSGGTRDYDSIRAMGLEFWDDLRRQVRRSKAEVAILSGEYFYGLDESKVLDLKALLEELSSDIDVVCYVRDPAAYYVSMMQQRVKASHIIRPPGQFQMRARVCLSRYLEAFDGRVFVRSADRSALLEADVVHDFLGTFVPHASTVASQIQITDLNESMSAEAMCILQAVRRHGWPDQNDHFAAESTLIWRTLNAMREVSPQTPPTLRPAIRAEFLRNHRRDLDFLNEQFGVVIGSDVELGGEGLAPPPGWMSQDLREILDVNQDEVERVLFALLKELAATKAG